MAAPPQDSACLHHCQLLRRYKPIYVILHFVANFMIQAPRGAYLLILIQLKSFPGHALPSFLPSFQLVVLSAGLAVTIKETSTEMDFGRDQAIS